MNFRFLTLIAALSSLSLISAIGHANEPEWVVSPAVLEAKVQVHSTTAIDGRAIEVVTLPNGEQFSIESGTDSAKVLNSGLTEAEINKARETSRAVLELTLQSALSNDFNGAMEVDLDSREAAITEPAATQPQARVNLLKRIFAYNADLYKPAPANLKAVAKIKRFGQMVWQFVIVETLHAGIDYYIGLRKAGPRFNEFGLVVDLKIEPQVFLAKFNPTQKVKALSRNYVLLLEIAYNRETKRLRLNTRFRREKGAGGLGLPAVKAELKVFQSDGYNKPYKGKAWYPISPPLVSFVLDSSEHYYAQGITVGLNSGDLVPGSTLTNTFTTFVQDQRSIGVNEVPARATEALAKAKLKLLPRPALLTCSAIFG